MRISVCTGGEVNNRKCTLIRAEPSGNEHEDYNLGAQCSAPSIHCARKHATGSYAELKCDKHTQRHTEALCSAYTHIHTHLHTDTL